MIAHIRHSDHVFLYYPVLKFNSINCDSILYSTEILLTLVYEVTVYMTLNDLEQFSVRLQQYQQTINSMLGSTLRTIFDSSVLSR